MTGIDDSPASALPPNIMSYSGEAGEDWGSGEDSPSVASGWPSSPSSASDSPSSIDGDTSPLTFASALAFALAALDELWERADGGPLSFAPIGETPLKNPPCNLASLSASFFASAASSASCFNRLAFN
jgi:hypothetical protein